MHVGLLAVVSAAHLAFPVWTEHRLNTYVHCANCSGPWSDAALAALRRLAPRFVVQERCTGRFAKPVNASAETKMVAAAKQIKAVNESIEVYMYNPVFPVVDWYNWGRAADRAAAQGGDEEVRWPNSSLFHWGGCGKGTCGGDHVIDFRTQSGRDAWVGGMVKTVKAGMDGVFIDGFRSDVGGGKMGLPGGAFATNRSANAAWGLGLNRSVTSLREQLGPQAAIIGNYGLSVTTSAANGRMIERGGSGDGAIRSLQALARQYPGEIVEYHAQYADRSTGTFNSTLATFMLGMGRSHYFGTGDGWGGTGAGACAKWLLHRPEFFKPIGAADGLATQAPDGQWSRSFATGTRVFGNGSGRAWRSCIVWADHTTTGDACTDRHFMRGGYAGLGHAMPSPPQPLGTAIN
jgi:hypothetical protein